MKKYISTSKVINILAKLNGKIYSVEFIRNSHNEIAPLREIIVSDLKKVCTSAGQDPGDYVSKWVSLADFLIVARYNDEVIGFSIAHKYKADAVFFVATMIGKEHNNQSLGKFINYHLLRSFFWTRFRNPLIFFRTLYFIFRTQNPILYSTWSKHTSLYPALTQNETPKDVKELAISFVQNTWGNVKFDSDNFVIHNAYINTPGLAIKPNQVSWVNNVEINKLFEDRLHLSAGSIDALVIVGKVSKALQIATLAFKPKL